jgi:flagellar hook-length control protein FliK
MEASPCAAPSSPSGSAAPHAPGHAASARARKLAAAADADTKPGFAELLGRRLDKASGDDKGSLALDEEMKRAMAETDAGAKPDDDITVAVPSDPGSAAWWAQRMRLHASTASTASTAHPGAAAASAELLRGSGRHAVPGAAEGLESLEGLAGGDERSTHAHPSAKGHAAHAENGLRQAIDAAGERMETKSADSAINALSRSDVGPAMSADAAPKAAELATAASSGTALNPLVPTDGLSAARTDQAPLTQEPAALPSRDIAPPVASPAFAPALGEVMTLLLSEGTHEARLQLNPQELGPVTVKIELDGAQAHVHFVAGAAEARDALQAAMPLLQQALQESGLSLAGGGVFGRDGSGGGAPDGRDRRGAQKPAGDREGRVGSGTVRQITRGVIDFYA